MISRFKIIILSLLISFASFAQKGIQSWITHDKLNVKSFSIDSMDKIEFKLFGCVNFFHLKGNYIRKNDSIYAEFKERLVRNDDSIYYEAILEKIQDTLIMIDDYKIYQRQDNYVTVYYSFKREEYNYSVESNGNLNYKAFNFNDSIIIEHFRFNKWTPIDTLSFLTEKHIEITNYNLKPHSGTNLYRLRTLDRGTKSTIKTIQFISNISVVTTSSPKTFDKILFSQETYYEIFDSHGKILKTGRGLIADFTPFEGKHFYLNFDNKNIKVTKK